MDEQIKATIELDGKRVTLEGPKDFVESEVRRLGDLIVRGTVPSARAIEHESAEPSNMSEREFIAAKRPKGHLETVTVLGFYLAERGQPEFSEDDIRRAYIRANVRPPKVVGQSLRDAKSKKDFIEQGKERGTYKLSNHGDRFVRFDLPSQE
jgi:hypothetical protein